MSERMLTDEDQLIEDAISDCVSRFFWDDRKEDEELELDALAAYLDSDGAALFIMARFAHHVWMAMRP